MATAADDSFLPRIQSVFYAVFDIRQGPKVVYEVPEGLIASAPGPASSSSAASSYSSSPVPSTPVTATESGSSRASSVSVNPHPQPLRSESRLKFTSPKRSLSSSRTLFYFDDVSKCKIIGFPVELRGHYERNYFRFNVCFVFDRSADLSCYEPIVRKVSRVLAACEDESAFLSSPETSHKVHAILEQLYEDLNSYSETSIAIDNFNTIELKIFPFFPNPPPVKDWMVPLALINLEKIIEPNWDLTIAKVCQHIDGTNHVSRIAHLAHCDLELTRQAIAHLLYYQVVITIDIFQYSNMYTLRKSVQWLADEAHIKDECGPYTVREGRAIPDWPKLLHLYSRLKPGKTVFEWMQDHDVKSLGIDARRFTSFGVIKGFLRRVHRWPVLLDDSIPQMTPSPNRKRSMSIPTSQPSNLRIPLRTNRRPSDMSTPVATITTDSAQGATSPITRRFSTLSAAEISLGQQLHQRGSVTRQSPKAAAPSTSQSSLRRPHPHDARRSSLVFGPVSTTDASTADPFGRPQRPRISRSPSGPVTIQTIAQATPPLPSTPYPDEFLKMLDGEHHTDELCSRFGVGWPTLEKWLAHAGGGTGDGDLGKVLIMYR